MMNMNIEMVKDELKGCWKHFDEMLDAIEAQGYTVEYATEEYIEIAESDDQHYILLLDGANGTMWIKEVAEL